MHGKGVQVAGFRICLLSAMSLLAASATPAADYSTLFHMPLGGPGSAGSLVSDGARLYGTTQAGGSVGGGGYVFSIKKDGTDFQNLYTFSASTNNHAITPEAGLILSGSTLYGNTYFGGAGSGGIAFSVGTDGTNFRVLHQFNPAVGGDGALPNTRMTLDGSTLYGVTGSGTGSNSGVLFAMNTDGSNYRILHTFNSKANGSFPFTTPLLIDGKLYGASQGGGGNSTGMLYSVNTDGSGFQSVFSFPSSGGSQNPTGDLTLVGSTLYGVGYPATGSPHGSIYSVGLDGSNFQVLHTFNGTDGSIPFDIVRLVGGLTAVGSTLYGTTPANTIEVEGKLVNSGGEIFSMGLDGSNFQILNQFGNSRSQGAVPYGTLIQVGSSLYGTTQLRGRNDSGTIYQLVVPEPATLLLAALGFGLWRATNRRWRRS